jgi:general secretion pathway protein B
MSYILDALKKSEQQRQRGAAPSLLAAQTTDAAPRQPVILLYGLAAAALLVAGLAIGILRPWQAEAPAPQSVAVKPPAAIVPPAAPAPAPAPASVEITIKTERQTPAPTPVPTPATQPPLPPAGDALSAKVPAPAAPAQSATSKSATIPETRAWSPAPERPAGARPADPAPERPPMTIAELPVSIQQEIPKLSMLFHLYSANPKDRLVGINDRMLREGDAVEPGLVLEQITPDGVILTYKGYRFLRGAR